MATIQYRKITSTGRLIRGFAVLVIIIFCIYSAQAGHTAVKTVQLTLHPTKFAESGKKYRLLLKVEELDDADAAPLYEKAVKSLPDGLNMEEINKWLKTPLEELPLKKVQSAFQQVGPSLEFLKQAAVCKRCEWPYLYDDELTENLREHRRLLFLLALKVRFQVARGGYDEAIETFQAGFAMARHLGDDSTLVRGMVGIGIAAYMCRQIEQFVQGHDAPNLYHALQDLPKPFIDLTEQAKWEEPDIKAKVSMLMMRLDRHIAVLQCIEAIRDYAATHDGQLPRALSDINQMEIPEDVMSGKAFEYNCTATAATLKSVIPEGGDRKDAVDYMITLKK